ncbi:transposase, partial [Erwinia amylovora]
MRKARFTEHQIIAVLKSVEAGRTVKDVCREAGISEASYYNWKAKFGGMEASDIKKMKDLEDENRRLKQMFADLSLECRALKDVIEKMTGIPLRYRAVEEMDKSATFPKVMMIDVPSILDEAIKRIPQEAR